MNRALHPRRTGCLQLMLLSFVLLDAALLAKGRGSGIDRWGFLYMAVLSGGCLAWLRLRK